MKKQADSQSPRTLVSRTPNLHLNKNYMRNGEKCKTRNTQQEPQDQAIENVKMYTDIMQSKAKSTSFNSEGSNPAKQLEQSKYIGVRKITNFDATTGKRRDYVAEIFSKSMGKNIILGLYR